MKAPRYFGAILDGWLAAEHLMAGCTNTYVRESVYYTIKRMCCFGMHSRVIL